MNQHESLRRQHEVPAASERSFGLTFAAVCALAAVWSWWQGGAALWWLGASATFLVLGLWWHAPLKPLNQLWFRFGSLLYKIVNPVVMAILFFGVVMPVGLLMRACGKDPLCLKPDRAAASYWKTREQPPGPMNYQF